MRYERAGFLSGVLVSIFSKTLVLLTGVAIVVVQVSPLFNSISVHTGDAQFLMVCVGKKLASRYGVDILGMLEIRQRVESSRVLTALSRHPSFKLAFGTTFALAAFMQF